MVMLGAQGVQSENDIGGNRPEPGRYHVVIKDVDESMQEHDKVIVDFEVLDGTVPGMRGRTFREFYATSAKAIPRLQRLAMCLGLLKPNEPDKDVAFEQARGFQLVVEVEANEYEDKDGNKRQGVRVGYMGMWSVGNPAAADVPKDQQALALIGAAPTPQPQQQAQQGAQAPPQQSPAGGSGNGQAAPPQQQQQTPPQQQAAGADKWANL